MHKVHFVDFDNKKVLREETVDESNEALEMAESMSKVKGQEILLFDSLFRTLKAEFSHYTTVRKGTSTLYFLNFKNVTLSDIQLPVQLTP